MSGDDGPGARPAPMDACRALADVVADLAAASPPLTAEEVLTALAERVAGIRPGLEGLLDLKRGGSDCLPGRGFRAAFDDGTEGQARHFAGIVASVIRFGPTATTWLSEYARRDAPDTADGRLTDAAVEFAEALLRGELAPADAANWIRTRLCATGE